MHKNIRMLMILKSKIFLGSRVSLKGTKKKNSRDLYYKGVRSDLYSFFVSYHKGMCELYYYGKVLSISKCLISMRLTLRRLDDRSQVSIFLNSPYLLGIFFFHDKK